MATIRVIPYGSQPYEAVLELRDEILRKPLGRRLTEHDTAGDRDDYIIAASEGDAIVGCVLLRPAEDGAVLLRAMAVHSDFQGRGLGREILAFAERLARDAGFRRVDTNARVTARGFYEKAGFAADGDLFTADAVPHFKMWKVL